MRIGCLMVTANRAPIAGIGISSFLAAYPATEAILLILDNHDREASPPGYVVPTVVNRLRKFRRYDQPTQRIVYEISRAPSGIEQVPALIDVGCDRLFNDYACDVVAIMDDDDYSPVDRLAQTAAVFNVDKPPAVCGYTSGWFVNLRTWYGERVTVEPLLWGGSLAFTHAAWRRRCFTGLPPRAYDRAFAAAFEEGEKVRLEGSPIAFSHGKNVSTWPMSAGENLTALIEALPDTVLQEVKLAQKFLIDRRIFPPQPV